MQYRIIQKGNKFFPQRKILLWFYIEQEVSSLGSYYLWCHSKEQAEDVIENDIIRRESKKKKRITNIFPYTRK